MTNKLYFLIGASGAGKTTAIREVDNMHLPNLTVFYFDSIGVPPFEVMEKEYGSTDEWQRATTIEWIRRMKEASKDSEVVLDGQTRPSSIHEGCEKYGITNYEIILFDCSNDTRTKRLEGRGQPELASAAMMDWARRLREWCNEDNACEIIDNTKLNVDETRNSLLAQLGRT